MPQLIAILDQPFLSMGVTWVEEFHGIVNAARAALQRQPLKIMGVDTLSTKKVLDLDIGQIHAEHCRDQNLLAHESALFPEGYRTFPERGSKLGIVGGGENMLGAISFFYSNTNPVYTFPTPQSAYDDWYSSPGHRDNMLRDYPPAYLNTYSLFGLAQGIQSPSNFLLDPMLGQGFYLNHNFLTLEEVTMNVFLSQQWESNGCIIGILTQQYQVNSYTKVRASHQSDYKIALTLQLIAPYGYGVTASHETTSYCGLSASFTSEYAQSVPVAPSSMISSWDTRLNVISVGHAAPFTTNLSIGHTSGYEASAPIRLEFQSPYEDKSRITTSSSFSYGTAPRVAASASSTYEPTTPVRASLAASSVLPTPLKTSLLAGYDMGVYNRVTTSQPSSYTLAAPADSVQPSVVTLTYGATTVRVQDGYVSTSRGESTYKFEVRMDDLDLFRQMSVLDPVTITINGEVYNFIITSTSTTRSQVGSTSAVISGASPACVLGPPFAQAASYAPTTALTLSDVLEGLAGASVTMYVYDWILPAGRISISRTTPLDACNSILQSIRAYLCSAPDGSLETSYEYPKNWNTLQSIAPDHVLDEESDVFSSATSYAYRTGLNRFNVQDGDQSSFQDAIDWEASELELLTGIATVTPSPYRASWTLITTQPGGLSMEALGEQVDTLTELVEFKEGSGGLSKPIITLNSLVWLSESLGGVAFTPYSKTLSCGLTTNFGYGVARVTYQTKAYRFKVSSSVAIEKTQLLVKEN